MSKYLIFIKKSNRISDKLIRGSCGGGGPSFVVSLFCL